MVNSTDSDASKKTEDKTGYINKFTENSKIALKIWLILGIIIILQYPISTILVFISSLNTNSSNNTSSITYEKVVEIVDKKTQETYSLINILLFVLTALPIAGNYYFWLLHKSVRDGMIEDSTVGLDEKINDNVQKELEEKIPHYIKEKIPHYIKEENLREEIANIFKNQPQILEDSISKSSHINNMLINEFTKIEDSVASLKEIVKNISLDLKNNNDNNVNNNIDEIHKSIKNIEQSIDLLKKGNYYFNVGMENYLQGNYLEAIEEYDKAIKEDSKYDLAWYYKGEAYRQLGNDSSAQNNSDEASKNYSLAINAYTEVATHSKLHRAFFYKAICQASIKQNYLAFDSLREAIKLNPKYKQNSLGYRAFKLILESDNLYEIACLYAILDEKQKALDFLEEALKIEDEHQKNQIKEQLTKQPYFDEIKNSDNYQDKFKELMGE